MKQTAIISLALVPLITACSTASLGPPVESQAKRPQSQSHAAIHAQLRKLRRRVQALNRRVAARGSGSGSPVPGYSTSDMEDVKARLAELEAVRVPAQSGTAQPSADTGELKRDMAQLTERLEQLAQRVEQVANATPAAPPPVTISPALEKRLADSDTARKALADKLDKMEADREKDRTLVIDYLEGLDQKIEALEKAAKPDLGKQLAGAEAARKALADRIGKMQADLDKDRTLVIDYLEGLDQKIEALEKAPKPDLDKRLAGSDSARKALAEKFDKMQSDLEKDRTLVIDYLEDLDKRIEALEKSAAPATQPAQPATPSQPAPTTPTPQ